MHTFVTNMGATQVALAILLAISTLLLVASAIMFKFSLHELRVNRRLNALPRRREAINTKQFTEMTEEELLQARKSLRNSLRHVGKNLRRIGVKEEELDND